MTSDRSISIITAINRKEPGYLRLAGNSLVELSKKLPEWTLLWLLAVDGIDPWWIRTVTADLNINKQVVEDDKGITRGPAFPRNRALRKADSEWLLNLDADDEYIPNNMAELLTTALQKNAVWAAGTYVGIDFADKFTGNSPDISLHDIIPVGGIKNYKIQYGHFPIHCSAAVARTRIVKESGGWVEDPVLTKFEDTAMWAKINESYSGILLSKPVLRYRKHQSSFTHQPYWNGLPDRFDLVEEYIKIKNN
jgi:glycosyltransferase involved in cell wall biosynthesis